jgi:hypothetical protein
VESESAVWFGKRASGQKVEEVGIDLGPFSGSRNLRRFVRDVGPRLSVEWKGRIIRLGERRSGNLNANLLFW